MLCLEWFEGGRTVSEHHSAYDARFMLWGFIPKPTLEAMERMMNGLPWGDGVAIARFRDRLSVWFGYRDVGSCTPFEFKDSIHWFGSFFRAVVYKNGKGPFGFFLEITIAGKDKEKYEHTQRDCRSARSILFNTTEDVSDRLLWFAIHRDPTSDEEIAFRRDEMALRLATRVQKEIRDWSDKVSEVHQTLARMGFKDTRDYQLKSHRCMKSGKMVYLLSFKKICTWHKDNGPVQYSDIEDVLGYVEKAEQELIAWQESSIKALRATAHLPQISGDD